MLMFTEKYYVIYILCESEWVGGLLGELVDEWVGGWVSGWVGKCVVDWVSENNESANSIFDDFTNKFYSSAAK